MKKILIFFSIVLASGCGYNKINIDKNTLNKLAKVNAYSPSVYQGLYLFIDIGDNYKACTHIDILHTIYVNNYSHEYDSFRSFLEEVLDQRNKVENYQAYKQRLYFFKIDDKIKNEYQCSKDKFFKKYIIKENNGMMILNKQRTNVKIFYSVLYYLFINNYEITVGDDTGTVSIFKGISW